MLAQFVRSRLTGLKTNDSRHPSVRSKSALKLIRREADHLVILEVPEEFLSVSQFYDHFPQVSDDEVSRVLSLQNSLVT
jgi:predicted phosphoribosyltransferase